MGKQPSALSELRKLGLTIDIDEAAASRIWGELLIIAGRVRQGYYTDPGDHWFIQNGKNDLDAYHAIAREIVKPKTPDEIIDEVIPRVVHAFHEQQQWFPPNWPLEMLKGRTLSGPIQEWKGKRFLMAAEKPSLKASERQMGSGFPKGFSGLQGKHADMSGYLALVDLTQRQRECYSLRKEYDLSLTEVAGRLGIDRKTAYEHVHQAEKKMKLQLEKRRDRSGRIKIPRTIE